MRSKFFRIPPFPTFTNFRSPPHFLTHCPPSSNKWTFPKQLSTLVSAWWSFWTYTTFTVQIFTAYCYKTTLKNETHRGQPLTIININKCNSKCWKLVFRAFHFKGMFDRGLYDVEVGIGANSLLLGPNFYQYNTTYSHKIRQLRILLIEPIASESVPL